MKNSIPRYTFYKNKYGSELLIDVVELKYVKRFLAKSAVHTLTYSYRMYTGELGFSSYQY